MKILPAVYRDFVTVANAQAQQQALLNAHNNLLSAMRTGTNRMVVPPPLDTRSIEASYSQLINHMQVKFQQLCVHQPLKYKKGLEQDK